MDTTVGHGVTEPQTGSERLPDGLLGRLLDGRYRVERVIARGGMATVYAATDTRLDRTVAVKVMRPALAEDPDFVERFAREARAAARLSSPEVVAVHDQGTDEATGTAYLVMEHVSGGTLRDVLRGEGALSPSRALDLLEPVLVALAAAHAAGLVHRDVKPENVLLSDDGRVKVADFGLARAIETSNLTATTGLIIGTVAYLAPEQVEHGRTDTRTDVYAAGVLLFELLTGTPPYTSDSPMSVAYRHVHDDVPPPGTVVEGIPSALDDLVVRATRRDAAARPPDAGAFLAELRAVRADLAPDAGGPVVRRATSPTLVVPREPAEDAGAPAPAKATADAPVTGAAAGPAAAPARRRRRPLVLALVLALLAAAVVGGGWYLAAGRWTDAPAVEGLPAAEAQQLLEAAGLRVERLPAVFSETVPPDHVVDQDPSAGDRVLRGGTVTLLESKGPDRRAVPELAGRDEAAARTALAEAGLAVGEVSRRFSGEPVGTVLETTPAAGERLEPGAPVALVLSKGVEMLPVPDVTGQGQAAAQRALEAAGFRFAVAEVFSETVAKGRVVAQDPSSGRAARGSTVRLQVSKGPQLIAVPDVVGQPRAAAVAAIEAAGLKAKVVAIPGPGRVRSTDPAAGAQVRRGTTVTVYVF